MSNEQIHHGGCLCGQVRYKTVGEPTRVGVCHCRYCQLISGSAFNTLVYFEEANVEVTGEYHHFTFQSESDKRWDTYFCPKCATTVFWRLEVWEGLIGMAGGTYDPPTFWYQPKGEVFMRSKAHFVGEINAERHIETFIKYDPKIRESSRLDGMSGGDSE